MAAALRARSWNDVPGLSRIATVAEGLFSPSRSRNAEARVGLKAVTLTQATPSRPWMARSASPMEACASL